MTQLYLSQRPSLQQSQVKGDMLLTAENTNTIMTRTRAKNSELLTLSRISYSC
jgi:importin-9